MSGEVKRVWLDQVQGTAHGQPNTIEGNVCPVEYSRFKYGDGDVASRYGVELADKIAKQSIVQDGNYAVTSSAYKVAPPASNSMLGTFVQRLQETVPQANFEPFKIDRKNLAQGDYALMSVEERENIMERNGLQMPYDFDMSVDGIIALDDILVTGSHERLLHRLFIRSGLSEIPLTYAYILTVEENSTDPRVESAINHCAIRSLSSVAQLSRDTSNFVPNARICKMLVSSSESDIQAFCESIDEEALETIREYIEGDELETMDAYRAGVAAFRSAYEQRDISNAIAA